MRSRMLGFVAVVVAALTLPLLGAQAASAAPKPDNGKTPIVTLLGNDVSWPQCGTTLPKGQAFAVIGVNAGLANDTNPCFDTQLAWAETSTGATAQPKVALYVNTANPGFQNSGGSWWPTSNNYPENNIGTEIDNPYGTCSGEYNSACAYMYGYAKAWDDAYLRGVVIPERYFWWLDVETINTWSFDRAANAATLEGMTDFFEGIGASVGLYSTGSMWNQIVGTVSDSSSLNRLPNWIPGASSEKGARANCSSEPFTSGSTVTLTQFISRRLDYNYSCS